MFGKVTRLRNLIFVLSSLLCQTGHPVHMDFSAPVEFQVVADRLEIPSVTVGQTLADIMLARVL